MSPSPPPARTPGAAWQSAPSPPASRVKLTLPLPGRSPRPSRVPSLPSPVQRYVAERAREHKDEGNYELNEDDLEREEQAKVDAEEASRGDNKDELKKRMGPNQEKPTDKVRILP